MTIKIAQVQTDDRLINQLQRNISSVIEPIFNNLSGSFVTTLTGCTTVPSRVVTWQRATVSGPVTIKFPTLTAVSNSTVATLTGLPSNLWPTADQYVLTRTYDNGTLSLAVMAFLTDGTIRLYPTVDSGAFTTSGTKGIGYLSVTYMTDN